MVGLSRLYPDLISGLFLAVAYVEIGLAERDGTLGRFSMAAIAVGLGFAPWLNLKNGVPVVIGTVAFAVVAARRRLPVTKVALTLGGIGLLLASRALYNTYYIGHLLGLPRLPRITQEQRHRLDPGAGLRSPPGHVRPTTRPGRGPGRRGIRPPQGRSGHDRAPSCRRRCSW